MLLCHWFGTHFGNQVFSCSQFAGFCSNGWSTTRLFDLLAAQTDQVSDQMERGVGWTWGLRRLQPAGNYSHKGLECSSPYRPSPCFKITLSSTVRPGRLLFSEWLIKPNLEVRLHKARAYMEHTHMHTGMQRKIGQMREISMSLLSLK